MRQAIKYQGTTIEPIKSAGEIQALVQRYGGTRCEIRWDGKGQVVGVRFAIRHDRFGEVPVRLTAKTARIEEILRKRASVPMHRRSEQAHRIAWRQLKDFVEQALMAVETGLFPLHEAFMAAVETEDPETGECVTWGELLERHGVGGPGGLKLLPAPTTILEADVEILP